MHTRVDVKPIGWILCALTATGGCAAIPSGSAAVMMTASGRFAVLGEGEQEVPPLSRVDQYDLRAQERDEDLVAITRDGVPVEARASLVTYSIAANELIALDREVGRGYYDIVVKPLVRSAVRRALSGYRADQLDTATVLEAQRQITEQAAARLRPFHIVLDSIDLRTLAVQMSPRSYRTVLDVAVLEQELLAQPQRLEVARQRGDALRQRARAIAAANARVAPTLTPQVLADDAIRASAVLMSSSSTRVLVEDGSHPMTLEVP
jgi:regulator of protease activity HflC (stomatin/prohibitin superfamily)